MALTDKELQASYEAGSTIAQLSEQVGMSKEWVRRKLKGLCVTRRKRGPSRKFIPTAEALSAMYQTSTLKQIADKFGVGETVVWNRAKELGVKVEGREMGHRGTHERSREQRESQSIAARGKWSGEKNPHWKGGVHVKNLQERGSGAYKQWKLNALALRGNVCQHCGVKNGSTCGCCGTSVRLHVHHVFAFASHPERRYDPENSEVLCPKCHAVSHGRIIG